MGLGVPHPNMLYTHCLNPASVLVAHSSQSCGSHSSVVGDDEDANVRFHIFIKGEAEE